ncbi:ABC transporter permease [Marinospirillum alkaliphilum]|uniref:Microcin C transport system permease protein n=1 Tax=Marinospirillum alkaliphilum DSM 21637 TaxID=1122209 RepID=A0A1K1WYZ4_9GAMM|nr:ABC transporter permease [Marinospirillum alkaliphilum]SFX42624.1 microcin C transport system permease protein [Marinospirillum alkaliphilum DSM 21637]
MPLLSLSPLNQRRWQVFKSNRRAWWSLWLFLGVFGISLMAELVANDKPLLIQYDGRFFVPLLKDYEETEFGGDLPIPADYRDAFLLEQIQEQGWLVWPLIPFSHATINFNLTQPAPTPPSRENWLGTDDQGRDVLARVIYSLRLSILFALVLTLGSSLVGIAVGALQGYFGGRLDLWGQRFIEIWSGLPTLFVLIILASMITPGFWWLLLILLLFSWTALVDLVRAECLRARNLEYVRAARALGLPNHQILLRHVLPNAMVATLTFLPFLFTGAVTTLTALDFLGFGMPPGTPSLGELVAQGKANLRAPWLGLTAFMTLAILLTLLVFIGEGIRDAFDPRKTLAPKGQVS